MDLSKLFSGVKIVAEDAAMLIDKADFYVKQIEAATSGANVSGAQKLAAVKAAILADLQVVAPTLATMFGQVWPPLNAVINGLVALYNVAKLFGFIKTTAPSAPTQSAA